MGVFANNLKKLVTKYGVDNVTSALKTNEDTLKEYISYEKVPTEFLLSLSSVYGINLEEFLSKDYVFAGDEWDRYFGNYLIYYYNNDSYKGEVHTNLKNTLNYGVLSIFCDENKKMCVRAMFTKERTDAIKFLKNINMTNSSLNEVYDNTPNNYIGDISTTEQSIFVNLFNAENGDKSNMILYNPPTKQRYMGGVGTVNSIARGREHNPCIQFIIVSKKLLDVPDGELYDLLKFDDFTVNMEFAIKDIIDLFKRLYVEKNEISIELTENQKTAIVRNKLEYHFNEILEANMFRFAKVSNKEDDAVYKLIKEGIDVGQN